MALNEMAKKKAKEAIEGITPFDVDSISLAGELTLAAIKSGGPGAIDAVEFNEELCNPWDGKMSEALSASTALMNAYRGQIHDGKAYLQTGQDAMARAVAAGSTSGYLERMENEIIPFFTVHLSSMMELGTACAEKVTEAKQKLVECKDADSKVWKQLNLAKWSQVLELMTQRVDLAKEILETQKSGISSARTLNRTASASSASSTDGGCYVATAVYGSYDCPQVWTLRRFRDYDLAETRRGRMFIKLYYAISPTLVKWFGETEWFKKMWRGRLDLLVAKCQKRGHADTPYEDRAW